MKKEIKNTIILEIKKSAEKFGVDFEYLFRTYFYLSQGDKKIMFTESMPETTNAISYRLTENKYLGNEFLKRGGFPVLEMELFSDLEQAKKFLEKHKEIVVKPIGGIHGKGVTVGLVQEEDLKEAVEYAKENDQYKRVLLEKFCTGYDHRVLVIGKEKVFAVRKEPAFIVGDGNTTIDELIDKRNASLMERYWVKKDEVTLKNLKEMDMDLESIPDKDQEVFLRKTANIKSGGTATDVTDIISEKAKKTAIEISKYMNLDVVGIDMMSEDISKDTFHIIEMNAYPGILLHIYPPHGKSHQVADEIVKYFFAKDEF